MKHDTFRDVLDQTYHWPDFYEFKFIVPMNEKALVLGMLTEYKITETPSKQGNYIAINATKLMKSTQEVLDVYELMGTIKSIISL